MDSVNKVDKGSYDARLRKLMGNVKTINGVPIRIRKSWSNSTLIFQNGYRTDSEQVTVSSLLTRYCISSISNTDWESSLMPTTTLR